MIILIYGSGMQDSINLVTKPCCEVDKGEILL